MTAAEPPPQPDPTRWGWAGWGFVALSFLTGFINFPLQVVGRDLDYVPGDVYDNRLNLCVLEHGYQYLNGKSEHFWDIGTFYPRLGMTAWSDAHIGMLPLYAALRAGGLSPERACQGWFLIPFLLNFAAAAWAARRLKLGPVGCAVAAYVFTYGLPVAGQLPHVQLFPRFLVPPALAFAWGWLRAPLSTWHLAVAAACLVYQTYVSVYLGYFLAWTLATGGVVALLVSRGRVTDWTLLAPGWRVWLARVVVALVAAAALYPLLNAHRTKGSEGPEGEVFLFAPRPKAWITPPGATATFPELAEYTKLGTGMPGAGEEQLLPGLLSLFGVAVGLPLAVYVLIRRPLVSDPVVALAVGAWTSVLLAVLVTKYGGEPDPTWHYKHLLDLPGVRGIRATSRVVLVLLFPAGFAIGAIFDGAARPVGRWSRWASLIVAVVALGAVAVDQRLSSPERPGLGWVRNPLPKAVERRERVAAAIRQHPNPKLVYAFPSTQTQLGPGCFLETDVMLAALELGVPTVNGYSGRSPPDWGTFSTYRELMDWLTKKNQVSPEVLDGLVVIGDPTPDADPRYEAEMRARFPPRQLGPVGDPAR